MLYTISVSEKPRNNISDISADFEVQNVEDRDIDLPKFDAGFAEFMGALAGDGHLTDSNHTYRIEFTVNRTEESHYAAFLDRKFRELFKAEPRIQHRGNGASRVMVHSKKIHVFLSNFFPKGSKDSLTVPKWIDTDEKIKAYLRGLMDTDGTLFFAKRGTYEKNSYPVMELKLQDPGYIDEVENLLDQLCIGYYRSSDIKIQLNGKKKLEEWMNKIGFSNPNRSSRYAVWKIKNYCPPDTTLDQRLNMIKQSLKAGMAE